MRNKKSDLGKRGEELALKYLTKKGYQLVQKNYRFGHGEIDLIVKDLSQNVLVFVEVKARYNLELGDPAYAINKKKITQLKKIAELYLYENKIKEIDCRFDIITIIFDEPRNPKIEHYENAFL
jgi:putative endonuclease